MVNKIVLKLFGYPSVLIHDTPVDFTRRKALALVAFLAVSKDRHSRESLAALLWPDTRASRAQANLRNVIYSINASSAVGILNVDRASVALSKDPEIQVDVEEFRNRLGQDEKCGHSREHICQLCLRRFTEAADVFRETFMAGFSVHDSTEFEQWQLLEAQSLQREVMKVFEKLIHFHESRRNWDLAITYAERMIALDSINESAHRRLIMLYAKSGNKSEAIRQYMECRRILGTEIDIEPNLETRELFERIRSGEFPCEKNADDSLHTFYRLPCYPTSFIGRRQELAQIHSILSDPGRRIVTLTGAGGSGKTRLALQAAKNASGDYPDGVVWIPLASVDSVEFIASTIAQNLNLRIARVDMGTEPNVLPDLSLLKAQLLLYLQNRRMLLVLDNFEHLLKGSAIVSDIIQASPNIQFLITSRERLNLQGEWVIDTQGLICPEDGSDSILEETDSVKLFVQSARQGCSSFNLTENNIQDVVKICRLVQGFPLAINLSASWVKVLSCHEIVHEIESSLDFLESSFQDTPQRHRSIRVIFEQSWRMLTRESRVCFRKLAVFRGGFDRRAAREIARVTDQVLVSLLDKSIVRRVAADRFEIHELLRQYAEERLESLPRESVRVRAGHSRYYLGLLQRMENSLKRLEQKKAVRLLSVEIENIRTAWFWAAHTQKVKLVLDSCMSLFLYYDLRNQYQDGLEMFRKAYQSMQKTLAGTNGVDEEISEQNRTTAGFLLGIQGWFLRYSKPVISRTYDKADGPPVEAFVLVDAGLKYLKTSRDQCVWALINVFAVFLKNQWSQQDTIELLHDCLKIFLKHKEYWGAALTYHAIGCWYWQRDKTLSGEYQKKCLLIKKQAGDDWGVALSHYMIGFHECSQGNLEEAKSQYLQSLRIRRQLEEDHNGLIDSLEKMGQVSFNLEEYEEAFRYYAECLMLSEKMTNIYRTARISGSIGLCYFNLQKHREAFNYLNRCLEICRRSGFEKLHDYFLKTFDQIPQQVVSEMILGR